MKGQSQCKDFNLFENDTGIKKYKVGGKKAENKNVHEC